MKMINEWKNKEYVCRGYYSISLIGFEEFDEETQELIKKLITTDEVENYNTKTNNIIQNYIDYYKNKGYSDDDIKVVKIYFVGLKENEIVYDIRLKVLTEHSELFEFIASDRGIELTSHEFNKERNEIGQKIKNKVQLIKLRKENEELKQKIKELQEKLKKYEDDEDG